MPDAPRQFFCGVNCSPIITEETPAEPQPLEKFRFFAVLGTWAEADVVGATVKNALTQGCERVYLLDNDSPDNTVAVALDAGATLAESYSTPYFDSRLKSLMINATVARVSLQERAEHIWWLYIDADEFPHGSHGLTLRQHLERLDRRFRIVGSRVFFHYPAGFPQYVSGYHPLDFQQLCEEFVSPYCAAGHWKHPLQRFDRHGEFLHTSWGFHGVIGGHPFIEPVVPVFTHHFQYRDEEVTRRRLQAFSAEHTGEASRGRYSAQLRTGGWMHRRVHTLDAVYARRWDQVHKEFSSGVQLRPWPELVTDEDARIARWYSGN